MNRDNQLQREAMQRRGSKEWADTQQPLTREGKINGDFAKVYGEQRLKQALRDIKG